MTTSVDLSINQGATWSYVYTHLDSAGVAVDLTGHSARMGVRADHGSGLVAYLSTGSDADGGTITLGGIAGTVTLAMTAAESAELAGDIYGNLAAVTRRPLPKTITCIYDLELEDSTGTVTRALQGRVLVHREVTT